MIVVGGSVAIDSVQTPFAKKKNLMGGSATFACLAARKFSNDVGMVGIVGQDYPKDHLSLLEKEGICLDGLVFSAGKSFTWRGEYEENMMDRKTLSVGINVLENWKLEMPVNFKKANLLVLANMSPQNQKEMLSQCSKKAFVLLDTMDLWIQTMQEDLLSLLSQVDVFLLNESEAKALTKSPHLFGQSRELLNLGPSYVVIKLGAAGAILAGQGKEEWFFSPAFPIQKLLDPTGAGDAFLGALGAYLDSLKEEKYHFSHLCQGVVRGNALASFVCEDFSAQELLNARQEEIENRLQSLKSMTRC